MSLAVIHVAHKLWIIGGVLTLVFYRKEDPTGKLANGYTEMITLNGPTINNVIMWIVGNWEKLNPDKYKRIINAYNQELIEREEYNKKKEKRNKKILDKRIRIKSRKKYKRLNNIPLY